MAISHDQLGRRIDPRRLLSDGLASALECDASRLRISTLITCG